MHYPTRRPLPTVEDRIVALLAKAPATRSQLCEALDTSRTNLGRALTTLLDEGSVTPVRTNAPGRGRPTQLLTLNSSAAHCVGLNVTRTSCAGVMLSRAGAVLAAVHIVSPTSPSLQLSLEQTCEALAASAARQGIDTSTVRAVGVGVPIPMGRNARLSSDAYPTVEELSDLTRRWWDRIPVVDNTVRMAALAEAMWGAGADMSSFIYLRLSGGVGGCVVSDYRLVGGAGGLAGELGHMTVAANDSPCACGKRGCLETLASVPALCASAGVADVAELRAAVLSGNARAREALERAAHAVGYVLGSAALLINPRAIIVAGEIVDAFPSLRSDIAASMYAELLPVMEWDIDVVGASLGPLGAAQASAYIAAHPFEEDTAPARSPEERSPREAGPASSIEAIPYRGERP